MELDLIDMKVFQCRNVAIFGADISSSRKTDIRKKKIF